MPFGMAGMPELPPLEPLPGLPLMAPLGNSCLTGVTRMPVGVARLALSGSVSSPSRRLESAGQQEPPRTAGNAGYVNVDGNAETSGQPESPDTLVTVVRLAP